MDENPYKSPPALPDEQSEPQRRVDWWRAILFWPSHPVLIVAPLALIVLFVVIVLFGHWIL